MLLVTGITGHSGRYFLRELIDRQYEEPIRCIVRETSDTSLLDHCGLKIEKIVGDLNDYAMEGVDTILHIGSIFYSINIINAAVKNNVRRAIFVHTTGIYSKYKSAAEEYKSIESSIQTIIEQSNSPIGLTYLRPTMIYGYTNDRNMIVFIKMADKLRVLPLINHGKNLLQPVNGRDIGKAYFQILSKPDLMNGDYILSGEKPISMIEIFTLISNILNRKNTFISVPLGLGEFLALCLKFVTLGKLDYIERVQRMAEDRNFSHEDAERAFSYKPMPFVDGLKIEVEEYLNMQKK